MPTSKGHGKYIKDPKTILEWFHEYVEWCKNNPIKHEDYVGKDAQRVMREKIRPVTMAGFEVFCYDKGCTISNYFDNTNGSYEDYYAICTRIKKAIRQHQLEGGLTGLYNASITQRLNGLTEKQEIQQTGTPESIEVTIMEGKKKDSKKD